MALLSEVLVNVSKRRMCSKFIAQNDVICNSNTSSIGKLFSRSFVASAGNRSAIPFYGLPRAERKASRLPDTAVKRLALTVQNALTAFANPERADAVAAVGELTGQIAFENMLQAMRQHETGQILLEERPLVSKATIPYENLVADAKDITFESLANVSGPENDVTFGQAYGSFLATHGFDPDERDEVKYIDDPDLAYVATRYRQCHDFWHALTGLPPTVIGELALKWLELFQTGLPLTALSSTVGSLRVSPSEQEILWTVYLPWALKQGRKMPYGTLLNIYYEKEWNTPLGELRGRIGVDPAPQI